MSDITPTLNLIDSALNQGAPPSTADHAIHTIDSALAGRLPEATRPYETTAKSLAMNAGAGANELIATALGAPVDVTTRLINYAAGPIVRHVNMLAQDLGHEPVLGEIKHPFGGSESIKQGLGLVGGNPDKLVPQNLAEKTARGVGAGAAGAVLLPLGAEGLAAGGILSPEAATAAGTVLGAPDAMNATIGAVSGAGSTLAAEAVPEPYKPLAALAGGLAGGAPVVAAHAATQGVKAAVGAVTDRLTEEGAKRVVGEEMAHAATDPAAARESLATQPHEIVPGSVGTTGQVAGDTGLLNWERGVRQQNAAAFNDREATQNAAQTAHLESVQPTGNAADLPGVIAGQREATAQAAQANTDVVDALSNASVARAEVGQKTALEGLKTLAPDASPTEVSAHFRNVRDALETQHDTAVTTATQAAEKARTGSEPNASSPEQVGQNLRAPAEEARAAAKDAVDKLYAALPKDLDAPSAGIAAKATEIKGGMLDENAPMAGEEARLFGLAEKYGDQAPLANLNALRSSILSEKANLKRSNPQAYGRLTQLQGAVEDAIDHGIESRAALDQVAVRRGTLAPEDAVTARLNQAADEVRQLSSSLEVGSGRNGVSTGRRAGGNVDGIRGQGQANIGPGNAAGSEGLPSAPGGASAEAGRASPAASRINWDRTTVGNNTPLYGDKTVIDVPVAALDSAFKNTDKNFYLNEPKDEVAQHVQSGKPVSVPDLGVFNGSISFTNGRNRFAVARDMGETTIPVAVDRDNMPAVLDLLAKHASSAEATPLSLRAANAAYKNLKQTFDQGPVGEITGKNGRGQYDLSPAELTKKVFHPGDTGGEDVRAYVAAVGPEKANTALSDAAAAALHEKALRPDGTLDPKKVDSWLAAHRTAIDELPPQTRTKFENAANAQRAVEDAFAARRDALNAYDKSEAGKLMGLRDPGDVVREVGSVIAAKDGAKRLGELATAVKGNPAARDGLQRAVVEHVMNKFLPEQIDKAQAFIADKADVLGKVFSPDEIAGISKKLEAAQAAGTRLESAKANRDVALKEAQASETEALSRYDATALGKIMKTEGKANLLDKLGTIFNSSDSAKQMGLLAEEAAKVPGGTDALRKAVTEMIRRDHSTTAEVGTSGEKGLSRAALDKFMRDNTETLEKALSPAQVGKLKAIVDDQLRANRSITATKLKGGSDTAQNIIATNKTGGTILSLISKHAAESGAVLMGAMLGGPGGALVGQIGSKAMAALRDAGLNRVNEIRIRAALDPQFGKALLDEVPKYPDRNAAALIALRARQLSVAGAMGSLRNGKPSN